MYKIKINLDKNNVILGFKINFMKNERMECTLKVDIIDQSQNFPIFIDNNFIEIGPYPSSDGSNKIRFLIKIINKNQKLIKDIDSFSFKHKVYYKLEEALTAIRPLNLINFEISISYDDNIKNMFVDPVLNYDHPSDVQYRSTLEITNFKKIKDNIQTVFNGKFSSWDFKSHDSIQVIYDFIDKCTNVLTGQLLEYRND